MSKLDPTRNGAVPCPCWSCKGPVAERALFCSTCGAVQAPGTSDHFSRLGLPRCYKLDQTDLERQYFGFQRRLHPDRFASRSARERALSQSQAVALNEAYEILKDPLKRSAYLLRLKGVAVDVDGAATVSDPVLLTEAMEMREALDEAGTLVEAETLLARAEAEVAACQADLAESFAREDDFAASRLTTRLKYLVRFADEARQHRSRLAKRAP